MTPLNYLVKIFYLYSYEVLLMHTILVSDCVYDTEFVFLAAILFLCFKNLDLGVVTFYYIVVQEIINNYSGTIY